MLVIWNPMFSGNKDEFRGWLGKIFPARASKYLPPTFSALQKSFREKNVWIQHCWVRLENNRIWCLMSVERELQPKQKMNTTFIVHFVCSYSFSIEITWRKFCHFESVTSFFFSLAMINETRRIISWIVSLLFFITVMR